jgi:predicted DNA-binding transcriptional regulator YafY
MKSIFLRHMQTAEPLEVIYMDGHSRITQRQVTVYECEGNYIKVYCHTRREKRIFRLDHILSAQPVKKYKAVHD